MANLDAVIQQLREERSRAQSQLDGLNQAISALEVPAQANRLQVVERCLPLVDGVLPRRKDGVGRKSKRLPRNGVVSFPQQRGPESWPLKSQDGRSSGLRKSINAR